MGRELRSIVLTPEEFETAVKSHFDRAETPVVPARNVATVVVGQGPVIEAEIILLEPLLDGRASVQLESRDIIEVIVGYVRDQGHPLPRHGKKSLAWIEGELAMLIELDWF